MNMERSRSWMGEAMNIFKFILALFSKKEMTPGITAAQRRDQFCMNGKHRYNNVAFIWWVQNKDPSDYADSLTFTARHCKDCGHFDSEE